MDGKDKVAMYLEIYKLELERFYKSRRIEWRVNFSFWTLIVASGVFLIKHNIRIDNLSLGAACLLFLPLHFFWLCKIQGSQENIQQNIKSYEAKIEKLLSEKDKELTPRESGWEWVVLAVGFSLVLILIIMLLSNSLPMDCDG